MVFRYVANMPQRFYAEAAIINMVTCTIMEILSTGVAKHLNYAVLYTCATLVVDTDVIQVGAGCRHTEP
jgi:hypothetical protein